MGLAIAGVIANWVGVLLVYLNGFEERMYAAFLPYAASLAMISLIGLILAANNKNKIGGILIIIGSVIFIPLGLIGVFGGRKIINRVTEEKTKEQLEKRREKLKEKLTENNRE